MECFLPSEEFSCPGFRCWWWWSFCPSRWYEDEPHLILAYPLLDLILTLPFHSFTFNAIVQNNECYVRLLLKGCLVSKKGVMVSKYSFLNVCVCVETLSAASWGNGSCKTSIGGSCSRRRRRRRGACQERHWSHLEIFSAHGNLSHVQKISGAGDWLAFQPHQSPGVRHQRLAGPAPPPCHLFSNIFPSCTLSSPDHQKKDNWMVVWTLGQRHNGHPTILKIVSSARARACVCVCVFVCAWVFCNWGWVRWMNSPFGVVKRKLSFVPNKVLWERICHFLFQLWFGNAGGNLLGEAFFGVEIEMLFIKKNTELSQYTL